MTSDQRNGRLWVATDIMQKTTSEKSNNCEQVCIAILYLLHFLKQIFKFSFVMVTSDFHFI